MILSAAFMLLATTSNAWPAQNHRHLHHNKLRDFSASAWPQPTTSSAPIPTPTGSLALNGTYSNTTGVTWLPSTQKVRGVNLGSQFIIEPWMAYDEFNSMGCGDQNDEWQCVEKLGQEAADAAFDKHWDTWITREDIADIAALGLNVIRIPVGFWIREDLVQEGEYYPRGGLKYLDRLVGWAADTGLYVVMDLHGGPGSQFANQQYTGHGVATPGFYTIQNYDRAVTFLEWMAQRIHSNINYRTTGVLQVMNEPVHAAQNPNEAADMLENFYPAAYERIRAMEKSLGVRVEHELKIQYMGSAWGAGDPTSFLSSGAMDLLFDDHRYYKWDPSVEPTRESYLSAVCSDNRGGGEILIGEWSIAVADGYESTEEFAITGDPDYVSSQKAWYQRFWAAQVQTFERSGGWIFWTYKCNWIGGMDEWRWCYKSAVAAGVIPHDASSAARLSPCS